MVNFTAINVNLEIHVTTYTGVIDMGWNLPTCVNDTGCQFGADVLDTGDALLVLRISPPIFEQFELTLRG